MNILEISDRNSSLIQSLLAVWEDSVRATHLFLSDAEIENIKGYVPQGLKEIAHLTIAKDDMKFPVAFMGINERKIEMLFVANGMRGKGIGKELLRYGIEKCGANEVTVNEQNPQAIDFYRHMGFNVYKRSELDEQGNPYPIFYMRLEKKG